MALNPPIDRALEVEVSPAGGGWWEEVRDF